MHISGELIQYFVERLVEFNTGEDVFIHDDDITRIQHGDIQLFSVTYLTESNVKRNITLSIDVRGHDA